MYRALPTRDGDPLLVEVFDKGFCPSIGTRSTLRFTHYCEPTDRCCSSWMIFSSPNTIDRFLLYLVATHFIGGRSVRLHLSHTGQPRFTRSWTATRMCVFWNSNHSARRKSKSWFDPFTDNADSRRLATWLHEESGGAPAFVLDMLRAMLTEGRLEPSDGKYRLKTGEEGPLGREELPLPPSLRQVLQDRIKPLSERAHSVGSILALSRQGLPFDVLLAVSPLDENELLRALDELEDDEIVEHIRTADEDRFQLSHKRFRDVLLARVEASEIQTLHRAIGEHLEHYHRHRIDAISEELASHFQQAGLTNKAYIYLTRTAGMYLRGSLYEQATQRFDQALALEAEARRWMLLDDADDRLTRVYIARGRAMFHRGQLDEALADHAMRKRSRHDWAIPSFNPKRAPPRHSSAQRGSAPGRAEQLRDAIRWAEASGDETLLSDGIPTWRCTGARQSGRRRALLAPRWISRPA